MFVEDCGLLSSVACGAGRRGTVKGEGGGVRGRADRAAHQINFLRAPRREQVMLKRRAAPLLQSTVFLLPHLPPALFAARCCFLSLLFLLFSLRRPFTPCGVRCSDDYIIALPALLTLTL